MDFLQGCMDSPFNISWTFLKSWQRSDEYSGEEDFRERIGEDVDRYVKPTPARETDIRDREEVMNIGGKSFPLPANQILRYPIRGERQEEIQERADREQERLNEPTEYQKIINYMEENATSGP